VRLGLQAILVKAGLLLALFSVGGCAENVEPITADRIALAVDKGGAFIAEREKADGLAAIEAAADREAALDAVADVRAEYVPVWASYDMFQAAHEAWRSVLNQRGTVPVVVRAAVLSGWCSLSVLLDAMGHELPPILPCEEESP